MSKIIYDVYKRRTNYDTHENVIDLITMYINKNLSVLTDGIINNVPVLGTETRNRFASLYNISISDWKEIEKSPEYKKMERTTDILKLGLLYSYVETGNPIFINFLGIIFYSMYMFKYLPKGFDKNIMRYTLDEFDTRLDFKRYNGNLLMVIGKKTETFTKLYDAKIKKGNNSDLLFRTMLKDYAPRYNLMVKGIASKYHKNFKDPDVKIQIAYSKTLDGKNQVAGAGLFEAIRERTMNGMQYPSDTVLNMIGLGRQNMQQMRYRQMFINYWADQYINTARLVSEVLDEWMKRNASNLNLKTFRMKFIKEMDNARYINHIIDLAHKIVLNMTANMSKEDARSILKVDARKYVYRYILCSIYTVSKEIATSSLGTESITYTEEILQLNGVDNNV